MYFTESLIYMHIYHGIYETHRSELWKVSSDRERDRFFQKNSKQVRDRRKDRLPEGIHWQNCVCGCLR